MLNFDNDAPDWNTTSLSCVFLDVSVQIRAESAKRCSLTAQTVILPSIATRWSVANNPHAIKELHSLLGFTAQMAALLPIRPVHMISATPNTTRRKAVWGPKRTFAALAVLVLGMAPSAFAAGNHSKRAARASAGQPNSDARNH